MKMRERGKTGPIGDFFENGKKARKRELTNVKWKTETLRLDSLTHTTASTSELWDAQNPHLCWEVTYLSSFTPL